LPQLTFVPYGAGTKTSLVFFRKFEKGERKDDYQTYMCRINNVGYEATGRPVSGNEIDDVIKDFHEKRGW